MSNMINCFHSLLDRTFRLHHRQAVRFAARLVGSHDSSEEIVQNAWLKICARCAESPILHPKSYLLRATRNAAIDFALQLKRERQFRVDTAMLKEEDMADRAFEYFEMRQQLIIFAIALNELPKPCRTAFVMNKLEGRTHQEIAAHLAISVSMVEKHVVRALMHCRAVLLETQVG